MIRTRSSTVTIIMRTLVILLCLISSVARSQTQNITGKWKIVAINNGTYYSYKDSAGMQQFLDTLKAKKDSSESAGIFLRIIETYKDYHISFNADGTFEETHGKEGDGSTYIRSGGTYGINFAHMYIEPSANKRKLIYSLKFTETGIKLYHLANGLLSQNQVSDFMLALERAQ